MTSIPTILGMGHKQPIPVDDLAGEEIYNAVFKPGFKDSEFLKGCQLPTEQ